jgi:hypothetical protein
MTTDPTTIMNARARTMRARYVKRRLVTPCCREVPAWGWSQMACRCGRAWTVRELAAKGGAP